MGVGVEKRGGLTAGRGRAGLAETKGSGQRGPGPAPGGLRGGRAQDPGGPSQEGCAGCGRTPATCFQAPRHLPADSRPALGPPGPELGRRRRCPLPADPAPLPLFLPPLTFLLI